MDNMGQRIKKIRLEKNYSLKDLEMLCGISASTLHRYESDASSVPTPKIKMIADALDVSFAYLLGIDSRSLPYKEFEVLESLLDANGYVIQYYDSTETFTLEREDHSKICPLEENQIKQLADTVSAFFDFELNKIITENINKQNQYSLFDESGE